MQSRIHWDRIYTTKAANELSWYQQHAKLSVKLIREAADNKDIEIIDVGGGASILVDELLADGFEHITVLDLSESALSTAKKRLASGASRVNWLLADILESDLPRYGYDVWHDRAVFHFLITQEERRRYLQKVLEAVKPGGLVIIATFAEDGPDKCSGLPVKRYSEESLQSELGNSFILLTSKRESHHTPTGVEQKFNYCCFRRIAAD